MTTPTHADDYLDEILGLMKERKVSQRAVAKGARISPTTMCDFIQGKRGISTRKATRIKRFLEKQEIGQP